MKAIRRSMKGEKNDPKQAHISISQKSAIAILPPKKVIKALYDYHPDPSNAHELGFHKGDFFHVLSRENDEDWYEACNPGVEGARGLVPVSYFETIGKTERQSTESGVSTNSTMQPPQGPRRSSATLVGNNNDDGPSMTRAIASAPVPARASGGGRGKMVYGTVLYDFKAERDDELSANQGESIIIIAQSTAEWFVAKPIGRLGGPGLIPITFIEIRDMTSGQVVEDPAKAIQAAGVPGVADWKRMAAEYKAGSISLGKFEVPNAGSGQGGPNGNGLQQGMERLSLKNGQHYGNGSVNRHSRDQDHTQSWHNSQLRAPVNASVPRYCFENDKYRFIIECVMDDGSNWELSRYYQDFYDLQIAMLRAHPEQQDPVKPEDRVLPYMPGPVTYVTDDISNKRRMFLDEYVKGLLSLEPKFSRHVLVKQLFAPREGDFELDPNAMQEDYRLSRASEQSYPGPGSNSVSRQTSHNQMNNNFASQQRYMGGGQYGGPAQGTAGQQYASSRNQHPAYQNQPHQQHYADQPGSNFDNGLEGNYYPDEQEIHWDPRTTKLKFFFMDELKKARVESFTIVDVKKAIRLNIASHNRENRDVELFQALSNEQRRIVTTDDELRAVFVDESRPLISAQLV